MTVLPLPVSPAPAPAVSPRGGTAGRASGDDFAAVLAAAGDGAR
ncbi:MAG: hypothetical protein JWN54_3936, partial [Mycobacterium sp.]|nr:hypothetical protein [Mycobacterium sp.]